ncbi:MAG TPA: alanyl-tRNA editing protein [Hyphomicrobiaceae bacterium]|jgi:misacylated tRNA(Ala) deacylase
MPATEPLYRADPYLRDCTATVLAINDRGGIILDRTIFYPTAGGQPGDRGGLEIVGSGSCPIATTVYDEDRTTIVHVPAEGAMAPQPGSSVRLVLDWETRHRHMRMHTALHLLCALVKFPVTGGQIGADESRLDFDIADASAVDKDQLTEAINQLIAADHPVSERWISDEELDANPQLVRTMSVKPPRGSGRVRLVAIGENGSVDLQPCGGTHVRSTGEIGRIVVSRIEKKGKQNRRIRLAFA